MAYSTMINGTSGAKLSWQQSVQHRTLNSRQTQRDRHLNLALAGDPVEPAYEANRAPLLQWSRVLQRGVFPLSELRIAVQHFQKKLSTRRHMWASITGPITALIATLKRIQWRLIGAHMVVDHYDERHDLRSTTTKKLKKLLDEATNTAMWRKHSKGTNAEAMFLEGANTKPLQNAPHSPRS